MHWRFLWVCGHVVIVLYTRFLCSLKVDINRDTHRHTDAHQRIHIDTHRRVCSLCYVGKKDDDRLLLRYHAAKDEREDAEA